MPFLILAGLAFAVAMAGCLVANLAVSAMVQDLNRCRPRGERVDALGWYPGKLGRVLREHRAAHPGSPRVRRMWSGVAAMAAGLLACFAFLAAAGPSLGGAYGRPAPQRPFGEARGLTSR